MTFRVDFNNVADDGLLVKVSSRHVQGVYEAPEPGDSVFLFDDEGNECYGHVDHVRGKIIYVKLDESTWSPAGGEEETESILEVKGYQLPVVERPLAAA